MRSAILIATQHVSINGVFPVKKLAHLGLVGIMLSTSACEESRAASLPGSPPPLVYVTPVVRQDVPLYSQSVATVDGYNDAEIRARVRGYLKSQSFKDGAHVKAGDLLFTIEATEWAAGVASAGAAVARASAARDHDRVQVERDRGLLTSGMISQQDLDNASTALADSESQVQAAHAALQAAALNLSYTQVRTPIDGVAGLATVRVGNLVGQDGPTLLTTVSQTDAMRINFALSEVDYVRHPERFRHMDARTLAWAQKQFAALDEGRLAEGNDPGVELVLADSSIYLHKAIIVSVERQIDPSTGTLRVQALVANPDGLLRPGQYARARIRQSDAGHDELVVPQRAVLSVQGTYSVAVVDDNRKAHLRGVQLGAAADGLQIVTQGLALGDRVVVEGVQKVADGALVDARPAKPQAQTAGE
jgi:RND family efflux transporter MFP subunit